MIPNVDLYVPRAEERYDRALRLMSIAHKMEQKGWLVDQAALKEHVALATFRVQRFTDLFLSTTGLPADALGDAGGGSTASVKRWFWLGQGAPQLLFDKHTKRPQFNTELLIMYATDFRREKFGVAAAALYGLRKNKKLLEFCESYRRLSLADGRIHFAYNVLGTQTGRWTSSTKMRVEMPDGTRKKYSANAQQVPSKTPEFDFGSGKERLVESLRNVFVADPGCVIGSFDYDQLELRLIAYIYGALRLIGWIDTGADTHMNNAIGVFRDLGLPADAKKIKSPQTDLEKLINAARDGAKPVAYGVSYQMHSEREGKYPTLFKQLTKVFPGITEQQVNTYANRFFELHPEIKAGQAAVRRLVEDHGYQEVAISGRRLYYPATMRGFNQALNLTMQSTGAELVNRATLTVASQLDWGANYIQSQVHDELVIHATEKDWPAIKTLVESAMSEPANFGGTVASIPAEGKCGRSWGEAH